MTFIVLQIVQLFISYFCDSDVKVDFRILTAFRAVRGSHT